MWKTMPAWLSRTLLSFRGCMAWTDMWITWRIVLFLLETKYPSMHCPSIEPLNWHLQLCLDNIRAQGDVEKGMIFLMICSLLGKNNEKRNVVSKACLQLWPISPHCIKAISLEPANSEDLRSQYILLPSHERTNKYHLLGYDFPFVF